MSTLISRNVRWCRVLKAQQETVYREILNLNNKFCCLILSMVQLESELNFYVLSLYLKHYIFLQSCMHLDTMDANSSFLYDAHLDIWLHVP